MPFVLPLHIGVGLLERTSATVLSVPLRYATRKSYISLQFEGPAGQSFGSADDASSQYRGDCRDNILQDNVADIAN